MKNICFHNSDKGKGVLSNWSLSTFVINSVEISFEQYILYQEGVFNHMAIASQILSTNDVATIKMCDRTESNYDGYLQNDIREKVVYHDLMGNYSHNNDLKTKLIDSDYCALADLAVKGLIWDIRFPIKEPNRFDKRKYRERNALSNTLMKVREVLR